MRNRRNLIANPLTQRNLTKSFLFLVILVTYFENIVSQGVVLPQLQGVGLFGSGTFTGANGISLAGGTEIMFQATSSINPTPQNFLIIIKCDQFSFETSFPLTSQANAFNSQTSTGKLQYTLPSASEILRVPYSMLLSYDSLTFELALYDTTALSSVALYSCPTKTQCQVTMTRSYTPMLYYIQPQVIYDGLDLGFFVNPKSSLSYKKSTDLFFSQATIDGRTVDFEGFYDTLSTIPMNQTTSVRGIARQVAPNPNAQVNFKFTAGSSQHELSQSTVCSFDNKTCYESKILPVIKQVSATQGYTTGGQNVTFTGYGFGSGNIQASIDGVECKVKTFSQTQFTCESGANSAPSSSNLYIGHQGIKRSYYNSTSGLNFNILQDPATVPYKKQIATSLEAPLNERNSYTSNTGNVYKGFFKPPADGNYRFYMACDDSCFLNFSSVNMNPSQNQTVLRIGSYTNYRDYYRVDQLRMSSWFALKAAEYYYFEGYHFSNGGGDHFTVSVETDANTLVGHQHSLKEIQRLIIQPAYLRDKMRIILNPVDNGTASWTLMSLYNLNQYKTGPMQYDLLTPAVLKSFIGPFYMSVHQADIDITVERQDITGRIQNESEPWNTTYKSIYMIYTLKQIPIYSLRTILLQRISTGAGLNMSFPNVQGASSAPLNGSFVISCNLPNGVSNQTENIKANASTIQIYDKIIGACPQYRDKIDVTDGPLYPPRMYSDGRDIMIRFTGYNGDPEQFRISSSVTNPLVGINITFSEQTTVPYSTNLLYEPIPFEFLHTAETKPSVKVSVDSLPGVCNTNNLDCTYTYNQPTPLISSFSLSGTTVAIQGTLLNSNTVQSVTFANQQCIIQTITDTEIVCQIQTTTTGDWKPFIYDSQGLIPIDPNFVYEANIPIVVTGVTPQSALNPMGDNILTITGQNFPPNLQDGSTINITLSDGTLCHVIEAATTYIKCRTDEFVGGATAVTGTIIINSQTDNSLSLTLSTAPATIVSIVPNKVSPVLKTNLTLTVGSAYQGTLETSDLEVYLVDVSNITNVEYVNVIIADNTTRQIIVRYGGAYSGTYQVRVRSKIFGRFDTSTIYIEASGKVLDFSPKQGSIYGGTLITVTGYNFSSDILDNNIRIGLTDCLVQSSSNDQITCRTQAKRVEASNENDLVEPLIVYLKLSEEAVCQTSDNKCDFEWLNETSPLLSSIQDYTVDFDTTLNDYVLTLTGTLFPTTLSNIQVTIDGFSQNVISATDTEIKVQITQVLDSFTTDVSIVFDPIGTPTGLDLIKYNGITLEPILLSISPALGSPAGSLITATAKGLGSSTSAVTLLKSSDGSEICSRSITVTSGGKVSCITKATTIDPDTLQLKIALVKYDCLTSTLCQYQTSTSMPLVSSLALSSDSKSIVITGLNYFTSGYTPVVVYAGIQADSVTVDSATQLTATWDNGVPLSLTAISPEVYFQSTQDSHWASITQKIANIPSSLNIISDSVCSFAGGCEIQINNQAGLLTNLQSAKSNITICGIKAEISSLSTQSQVKLVLPALATTYSIANFNISTKSNLYGDIFSSSQSLAQTKAAFDKDNMNAFSDNSKNPCYIGMSFKADHIGFLTEVKFFMKQFKKADYVGKTSFQGSLDGVTYTTIFTVGEEIHEGWNYKLYEDGQELQYRYYRFYGTSTKSCVIGEIGLKGVEVIQNNSAIYDQCPIKLNLLGESPIKISGSITYNAQNTPLLTAINPRWGKVQGSELITFTGSNFVTEISKYTILLDTIPCVVQSATTTQVTCISGKRPGLFPTPTTSIYIDGMGLTATQGLIFRYVSYWSNTQTWGDEFIPITGDALYVPAGLHLLVDVDSTPVLSAVLVEGSLIFPPHSSSNHLRTFDVHYIMIRDGGYMEVGTEEFPYTSKLIITMHGNKKSPELPIYGNKCIAVRHGTLDMHGVPRNPTWTELDSTVLPGASQITLITSVDWQVGERIAIAPTGYSNEETEERIITAIDLSNPNKPIITLDSPLLYKHYSDIEWYGDEFIEMRAEVGLLTRNVVFRGDPETSQQNLFGAHIMLHSHGDDSLTGRIEYIELRDVGQAFQLGRYPIHFHLIGNIHESYIKGNTIWNTYNRAITFHGVHYLRVSHNVAYNTMGHVFFIEDAIETKNIIEYNLALKSKASFSLLITDQTPASFWITNPDNIFRHNHAAGSDRYGYWFDTKEHPLGPSYTDSICPENSQLGEFANNVAHSNGRYGVRIFHKMIPRQNPCLPIYFNASSPLDPYASNPLITATLVNITSWKNVENGAIAEQIGDVRFENFKVADNLLAGMEVSLSNDVANGYAQIHNALIIGHSQNAESKTLSGNQQGIITPRTENFQVHNIKFYNYDLNDQSALGSCSHCFHPASTDSGARTITFSNLYFDQTVTKRIRFGYPYRDIFYDLDGSLTELGAKTWATPYFEHNLQPECQLSDTHNGILCNDQVQVRRLVMYKQQPSNQFSNMEMKVLKYDDDLIKAKKNKQSDYDDYIANTTAYGWVQFRPKLDPVNSWAVPYVTGHKYKIHWRYGIDFDQMQIDQSIRWEKTDKEVEFVFNFTDVRARVDFTSGGELVANETRTKKNKTDLQTGDNVVYNDSSVREIHVYIDGKNESKRSVLIKGYRCNGPCLDGIDEEPIEGEVRRWSDPTSWESGKVPLTGENVEIKSGWNMLYDVAESPIVNHLEINGRLTFEDGSKDLHLRAKYIFVRAGELFIGTSTVPFMRNAKITLFGSKNDTHIVYDQSIEAGNKILANTNKVRMYGIKRDRMTRLTREAYPGNTTIFIEGTLDWVAGDRIGLAPTQFDNTQVDQAFITSYNSATGELVLDRPLTHYHYGAQNSTATKYGGILDIRGEVVLLTRNIKIAGNDVEAWGCQIVTSDFIEETGDFRQGSTIMDSVEVYNCSQYDTEKAALRFEMASQSQSIISNCAIHNGLGFGVNIKSAMNIQLKNNTIFSFVKFGVQVYTSQNVTLDRNVLISVSKRNVTEIEMSEDIMAGFFVCAYEAGEAGACSDITVTNNIAAGVMNSGFAVYGHKCNDNSDGAFVNNVAHSVQGMGALIFPNPDSEDQSECMEGSYFYAYKTTLDGAASNFKYKKIQYTNMIMVDTGFGPSMLVGQEGDALYAQMKNVKIYGEAPSKDCIESNWCKSDSVLNMTNTPPNCVDRQGLLIPYFATGGAKPIPKKASVHAIKKDAAWGGSSRFDNVQFIDYPTTTTFCGMNQRIINLNEKGADYHPIAKFYNTKFENINDEAIAFLFSPPQAWANLDDCGDFPCSGPSNTLIYFDSTTYTGSVKPTNTDKTFQIIPNNPSAVKNYDNCQFMATWNAFRCQNDNLGVLLFESLDEDKWRRMVSPIYVNSLVFNSTNKVNTFMDHIWDGFYTGQLRMGRWPSIIQLGSTQSYEIQYSGTPPQSQRFVMNAEYSGTVIRIDYTKPGAQAVLDGNKRQVGENKWVDSKNGPDQIKRNKCGENRYVGVENILEFYITAGCTLYIQPLDSIRCSVRMDWTLEAFFAQGGTTKFIDRLTSALGIHASNVKIVSVYKGSVIVDFSLQQNVTTPLNGGLNATVAKLKKLIQTSSIDFGAPILSSSLGSAVIIPDDSPLNTNNGGNGNGNNQQGGGGIVYNNTDIIIKEGGDKSNLSSNDLKILIIIGVIVALIIVGAIIGLVVYKVVKKQRDQRFINSTVKSKPHPLDQSSNVSHQGFGIDGHTEHYEHQYHPKLEYGNIYGINLGSTKDAINANNEKNKVKVADQEAHINFQHDDDDEALDTEHLEHNNTLKSNFDREEAKEGTPLADDHESPQMKIRRKSTKNLGGVQYVSDLQSP